ncbi:MAG: rhodanese-like domain-containing protein [Polyangiales bacterium]
MGGKGVSGLDPLRYTSSMDHSPRFLKLINDAKTRIREITIAEVKAKQKRGERLELVDVREDTEWSAGHIKGARHLGRGVLERDVEKAIPEMDQEIILYCAGGFRSVLAADNLRAMGYTRVFSMVGGYREWMASGGALET